MSIDKRSISKKEAIEYLSTLAIGIIIQKQDQKDDYTISVMDKDILALDMAIDALKDKPVTYYLDIDKEGKADDR